MKRLGAMISLTLLIVMMSTSFASAATLELVDSYPRDGDGGFQIENTGVKLYFNQDVVNKDNEAINDKAIKILNGKGKKMPIHTYYSTKEEGLVLVLVEGLLDTDSNYTLQVTDKFVSATGEPLLEPINLTFKTRDTSKDMAVNMGLMGVMFVGVLVFSSRNMKKQMMKEQEEKAKEQKVNPYKVSKETGKSVQEVVENDLKEKEKKARKESKKQGQEPEKGEKAGKIEADIKKINHYKVPGPKPISLTGSAYKTGRKAEAEKKAEAAKKTGTTRPKNQTGKAKNKKK